MKSFRLIVWIPSLQAGQIDLIMAGMSITTERYGSGQFY